MRKRMRLVWLLTLLIIAAAPGFTAPVPAAGWQLHSKACRDAVVEPVDANASNRDSLRQSLPGARVPGTTAYAAPKRYVSPTQISTDKASASDRQLPSNAPNAEGCDLHVQRQRGYPRVLGRQHG